MIGIGVLGVGVMGADHVRTIRDSVSGARVAAVYDVATDRARELGCRLADSATELIADPDVDAVLVASSDDTHEPLVSACLAAGKPVLCEKPLAGNAEGCLRLVEQEVTGGRRLIQVGFMRRYDPGYLRLAETLATGGIGAPLIVHCVHRNVAAPSWFRPEMVFTNSMTHDIDVLRWLLGAEITEVTVHAPTIPAAAVGPQLVVLRTESGVLAEVEVFVNARYGYEVGCEVVGESGTVSLPPPIAVTTRSAGLLGSAVPADWRPRFADAYREELTAWVRDVAAGTATGPSAWDGYAATAVAEACVGALHAGSTMRVTLAGRPALYEKGS